MPATPAHNECQLCSLSGFSSATFTKPEPPSAISASLNTKEKDDDEENEEEDDMKEEDI